MSRLAQEFILAAGITLVLNVKPVNKLVLNLKPVNKLVLNVKPIDKLVLNVKPIDKLVLNVKPVYVCVFSVCYGARISLHPGWYHYFYRRPGQ